MSRMDRITSFKAMDIFKQAGQYKDTIHFEIGAPDIEPSPRVIEAMHRAVDEGRFSYVDSLGIMPLREKIAEHYSHSYGIEVSPEQVVITSGTSGAFLVAYSMLLSRGEKIGLPDPSYPCYKNFARLFDIEPVSINIGPDTDFLVTVDHLKAHPEIRAFHLPSPSNPLGNIYTGDQLKALIDYCQENNIFFISDEIYHGLTYGEDAHTALEYSPDVFVINGFSKLYALPGLRLGWMIIPRAQLRDAEKVIQNISISAPTLSQYACLEAFDYEHHAKSREIYRARRDYLYGELKDIFPIHARPQGAFYIWADISRYGLPCDEFVQLMLKSIHVATTPGTDFGVNNTDKYIRLAYTKNIDHLREGVERIKTLVKGLNE